MSANDIIVLSTTRSPPLVLLGLDAQLDGTYSVTQTTPTAAGNADPDAIFTRIVDPRSAGQRYPLYHFLREHAPVFQTRFPPLDGWYVVSNYEYARAIIFSPKAQNNGQVLELNNIDPSGAYSDMMRLWMEYADDTAVHDRIRLVFFPHFTPRNLAALRPRIREIVVRLLDGVGDPKRVEVIGEFAFPLPALVIAEILGIDVRDLARFRRDMDAILEMTANIRPLTDADRAERDELAADLLDLFREHLERRRQAPRDDLISKLASEQGRISDEELLAQFVFVLIAGHSTTADLIGNALVGLAKHPDQLARLAADRSLIPSAFHEFLRYDSSLETGTRIVNEPIALGDTVIPAGGRVLLMLHAAHHDPAVFDEPDRLDIARANAKDAFPFGGGRYTCLGMALARMEFEEALDELLLRYPRFEIAELEWQGGLVSHGPKRLVMTTPPAT